MGAHGLLHRLFPDCARTFTSDAQDEPPLLFPEEALSVEAAGQGRRREFAFGRWCAHRALEQLGLTACAIPSRPDRSPIWPAGIVGSITHCTGFVGAVVAPSSCLASVGLDAELAGALPPELVPVVCTAIELESFRSNTRYHPAEWAKFAFSAKEAVHKCISPLGAAWLDFLDVSIDLHPELGTFSARPATPAAERSIDLATVCGRLACTNELVLASAFIEPRAMPREFTKSAATASVPRP